MTGGAVGEQVELLFLDAVLLVAAGAVEAIIQGPRCALEASQDIAQVGPAGTVLGLDDHAPRPVLAFCSIGELAEAALLVAVALEDIFGRVPLGRQRRNGLAGKTGLNTAAFATWKGERFLGTICLGQGVLRYQGN